MNTPDHPLPQAGGSYIRQKDGTLSPAADAGADPAPEMPVEPPMKGAAKPVKEA